MLVHEHQEFDALLLIVADQVGVPVALVEKDYWVTHVLWALEQTGLQVFFKGGTCLSKGYALIERFSEDLDVKVEAPDLPSVSSWTSEGARARDARATFFSELGSRLVVPGATVEELAALRDRSWRNVVFAVRYPSSFSRRLPKTMLPFVQLEMGSARVTPGEEKRLSSWIHDHLDTPGGDLDTAFVDNRPQRVHCVDPSVTLLEKIEAIGRRFLRDPFVPADFIRHYEDAARIAASDAVFAEARLRTLLDEMREARDIRDWPPQDHVAFDPRADEQRWAGVEDAWQAIGPLFWGDRIPLDRCADAIRDLLGRLT